MQRERSITLGKVSQLVALLIAIPAIAYPLGLLVMSLQLNRTYTHDFSTAVAEASLVSKTQILWLGLRAIADVLFLNPIIVLCLLTILCLSVAIKAWFLAIYRFIFLYKESRSRGTGIGPATEDQIRSTLFLPKTLGTRLALLERFRWIPGDEVSDHFRAIVGTDFFGRLARKYWYILLVGLIAPPVALAVFPSFSVLVFTILLFMTIILFYGIALIERSYSLYQRFTNIVLVSLLMTMLILSAVYAARSKPSLPLVELTYNSGPAITAELLTYSGGHWYVFNSEGDLLVVNDNIVASVRIMNR